MELAVEIAKGGGDFLTHDLVDAVKEVKDEALQAEFKTVNERAASELNTYADWLTKERLSQGGRFVRAGRAEIPPDAGRQRGHRPVARNPSRNRVWRNSNTSRKNSWQRRKSSTPANRPSRFSRTSSTIIRPRKGFLPDTRNHLERIRGFLVQRGLIDIPSEVRANVTETPQYLRSSLFAASDNPGPFEVLGAQAYYYVTPDRGEVERPGEG